MGRIALTFAVLASLAATTHLALGAPAQTDVIVSGTVVDATGQPVPSLEVDLYLPLVDARGSIATASVFIVSSTTNDAGQFTLKAEATPKLRALASVNDGWLNFDLLAFNATLTFYRSVTRRLVDSGWVAPPEDGNSTNLGSVPFAPGQPGVGSTKKRSVAAVRRTAQCSETNKLSGRAALWTAIGELHTATGTAVFKYGAVADSSISVAVQVGSAPWSTSGTVHIGNRQSSGASVHAGASAHELIRAAFVYDKVVTTNSCAGTRVTIRATKWISSKLSLRRLNDPARSCRGARFVSHTRLFASGQSFARFTFVAYAWPHAVDLSPLGAPGAQAFARSGYSHRVLAKWIFPSGGRLCGDTGPPSHSLRIFAGPRHS